MHDVAYTVIHQKKNLVTCITSVLATTTAPVAMAGRYHLCSGPEEILFQIVEHLGSPGPSRVWPDGQTIRFANDQVLHLSQVNHLFRRLCLPLLYEHIFIMLTNESTDTLPFDLFRRTMERKPHLADLVRYVP
jgi:hypothetical protein